MSMRRAKIRTAVVGAGLLLAAGYAGDTASSRAADGAPTIRPAPEAPRTARMRGTAGVLDGTAAATSPESSAAVETAGIDTAEVVLSTVTGEASYYHDSLAGNTTASGVPYDPSELVAAHPRLPFGTVLRVTNLRNEREVRVRVVDRGPFARGRILDLSRRAAEQIGMIRSGHAPVRIEVLSHGGR